MEQIFENYVRSIASKFIHPETSEMGYRADFEQLLRGVFDSIKVKRIDHDARAKGGNKPDFIVLNGEVPILYIEAKDIGVSLDKVEKSEQMARYFGYANLVLTDYTEFRFYRNGIRYQEPLKVAEYDSKARTLTPLPQSYGLVAKTLIEFTQSYKEPIRSGHHLAKIMGGKARRIRDNVKRFLSLESEENTQILRVYEAIKKMLVHDLSLEAFADMYAQTLVYGLFAARYYDNTPETFNRSEARDLVPASNPFLQHFFDHIAGADFDKRLSYIVDELCAVFQHANTKTLIEEYMGDADPVIHFYEDFLKEYDPELRKKMGAYYTPIPVARFIVRAVDDVLKKDFDLPKGLADTSRRQMDVVSQGKKGKADLHRVQILDPAVGTATFLNEVVHFIHQSFAGQEGRWPSYVETDLLPRLYGFELMMAPYTIAHLKLGMRLRETGCLDSKKRLGIYLTNSLEEGMHLENTLFNFGLSLSIAEESREADKIKNDTPIMVVLGNPPYSVSSSNKGEWIQKLIKDYKVGLGEKKINLDDDYIKFIRYAEHFIEKNKTGIVAMITNNSFIDGITHRQMRKHLLETFDQIYILDLHGNSKKKEKAPDGGKDENVFEIQQGVSINIFVRKNEKKEGLGTVYHSELFGKRELKFDALNKADLGSIEWKKLEYTEPYYFFVPKDFSLEDEYKMGFNLNELFPINSNGLETHKDEITIKESLREIDHVIRDFIELDVPSIKAKYRIKNEGSEWKVQTAKNDVVAHPNSATSVIYRPFDKRFTAFTQNSKGFLARPRFNVLKHLKHNNFALLIKRQCKRDFSYSFVVNDICEACVFESAYAKNQVHPLYLYSEDGTRTLNLKPAIVEAIEKIVGTTTPEDIFDYIYAVLHSPSYREKYKEFLKIDFPRVPYPKDRLQFDSLVALGCELRGLHLLESPKVHQFITTYPVAGSDAVEKVIYKDGKVFLNTEQYFGNVPEVAWNFCIGGYQPAQKWLKDRKGRVLTNEDIEHYQEIIVALMETDRIMKEIDKIPL